MEFFAANSQVDRRSRNSMVAFLTNHFRYNTMNSWNQATSYANCIKVHRLGLTSEQQNRAFDMLSVDYWDEIRFPIDDFTRDMNGSYTIGTNGRSSGYLVLYESHYQSTGHKSYCRSCGQRNFKRVGLKLEGAELVIGQEILRSQNTWRPEAYLGQSAIQAIAMDDASKLEIIARLKRELIDCTLGNRCGACGREGEQGRINYTKEPKTLSTYPGRGIDHDRDFDGWSLSDLRDRVELVQTFDACCDDIRAMFIDLLEANEVVEETIMIPKKVHVLSPRTAA